MGGGISCCNCINEKTARWHAILSAYISIIAGAVSLALSIWTGHKEDSMSLYSVSIMACVDIMGSVMVLLMWQCHKDGLNLDVRSVSSRIREMRYSVTIGIMMINLGAFLVVDSLKSLFGRDEPSGKDFMGALVAFYGAVAGIGMFAYKYICGKAMDSPVVVADAMSSLCSGITNLTALVVTIVDDRLWWSDSTAGLTAALYTLYAGAATVVSAHGEIKRLDRGEKGGPRTAPEYVKRMMAKRAGYQSDDPRSLEIPRNASGDANDEGNGGGGKDGSFLGDVCDRLSGRRKDSHDASYKSVPIAETTEEEEVAFHRDNDSRSGSGNASSGSGSRQQQRLKKEDV